MSERISVPDSISEQTSVRQSPVSVKESFTERLAKREQKESIETESSQKPSSGQVQFSSATQRLEEFENEQNVQPLQLSQKSNRSTGKQRNWSALLGQFLAFSGALAMTGGAAVVIGNRFGSLEIAETTGWLALAGGHLLFVLGLYTHLTSRVEQTWNDLHARTDEIGRLIQQQQNAQKAFYQESARLNQPTDSRSVNRG